MTTLMFQQLFAPRVKDGSKRQTIRPKRKRPIKPGSMLSLREWEGLPYRSKQRELNHGPCLRVSDIEITEGYIKIDGELLGSPGAYAPFAWKDGFASITEMVDWFLKNHGLPFHGDLIEWEPQA